MALSEPLNEQIRDPVLEEALVTLVRSGAAVLFAGAGCGGASFPVWFRLLGELEDLCAQCGDGLLKDEEMRWNDPLAYADQLIDDIVAKTGSRNRYHAYLYSRFGADPAITQFQLDLVSLPFRGIITTNYDRTMEEALVSIEPHPADKWVDLTTAIPKSIFDLQRSLAMGTNGRRVGHLHGYYKNPAGPSSSTPHYARAQFGPSYLIEFCSSSGLPTVEILVFVKTETRVRPDGTLEFPDPGGPDVVPRGISRAPLVDLTPEFGARLIHERLGLRIKSLPQHDGCIVVIQLCDGSQGRHWKYQVESLVRVRLESGAVVETDELFTQAGFGSYSPTEVYVASQAQPDPQWFPYSVYESGLPAGTDSVLLSISRPIRLERFEVVP